MGEEVSGGLYRRFQMWRVSQETTGYVEKQRISQKITIKLEGEVRVAYEIQK